jgi:hypothetical protein
LILFIVVLLWAVAEAAARSLRYARVIEARHVPARWAHLPRAAGGRARVIVRHTVPPPRPQASAALALGQVGSIPSARSSAAVASDATVPAGGSYQPGSAAPSSASRILTIVNIPPISM